jgi:uncharacterized repeat protein (TIGR03803 family)
MAQGPTPIIRSRDLNRFPLGVCVAMVMLAGCGGSQPPISSSSAVVQTMMHGFAVPEATQHHYKSLYSFKAPPDGAQPIAGLVTFKGTLYGTTYTGGLQESYGSLGTVFSITKKGNERVLYDFTPLTAWNPSSDLVALRGVLYGVASGGGYNQGVVYRTATSGRERILYSFKGIPDGSAPVSSLIALDGTLYGETVTGGTGHCDGPAVGCGTVFELSTSGAERVLYKRSRRFSGKYAERRSPLHALSHATFSCASAIV